MINGLVFSNRRNGVISLSPYRCCQKCFIIFKPKKFSQFTDNWLCLKFRKCGKMWEKCSNLSMFNSIHLIELSLLSWVTTTTTKIYVNIWTLQIQIPPLNDIWISANNQNNLNLLSSYLQSETYNPAPPTRRFTDPAMREPGDERTRRCKEKS